jgi:hypothetical protein
VPDRKAASQIVEMPKDVPNSTIVPAPSAGA